jgi:hypothetical protein
VTLAALAVYGCAWAILGVCMGWVLGYAHRALIGWGISRASLEQRLKPRRRLLVARRRQLPLRRDQPVHQPHGQHSRAGSIQVNSTRVR